MAKRKYQKKSDYWNQFKSTPKQIESRVSPDLEFEPLSLINASSGSPATYTRSASNSKYNFSGKSKFPNIEEFTVPFEDNNGVISTSTPIELCQKAYFNISYFRNTIEAMTEFSCTNIHVRSKNKTVKDFIEKWLQKIDIHSLQEQFFREYYRSGNVFIYKFNGRIQKRDLDKLENLYGITLNEERIPIRYVILNPINIGAETALFTSNSYVKVFNQFEINRLKNPKTDLEKQVFNGLPKEVQQQIREANGNSYLYMPLDQQRLTYILYKKQDYELMGVPMGYSVLDDIEHKLALKQMDRVLAKTVENIILLITTGAKPDEGGINVKNLQAIQQLFRTPATARVLVSDYTTKAQFITPDMEKILGPEKYQIVNQDIKEGLQNALFGENRFADTFIRTKMFIERLAEGQKIFLNRFLVPEIQKLCDAMNFKNYPILTFERIQLEDPNIANKVITRMMELGILTPDEGIMAMQTGIYPDKKTSEDNQKEFKRQKDSGLYEPLIGGAKEPASGRPDGAKAPKTTKKVGIQTSAKVSIDDYKKIVYAAEKLMKKSISLFKKHAKKKALNDSETSFAHDIAESVILNTDFKEWDRALGECYQNQEGPKETETTEAISRLSVSLELEDYSAALLYHAQQNRVKQENLV